MKKLLIGVVAALCCFTLAAPAFAQVKIGGMITTDFYVFDQDAERFNALIQGGTQGHEGRTTTSINIPQALNRFDVQWTSDDKKVHGRIQLRYGTQTAGGYGTVQAFDPEFMYIDYHWTPTIYTRFGRQEQTFAIMAPSQSLGQAMGHIVAAGWGNVHGGTARDGIKTFFDFSKAVRLEVEILDPDVDGAEAPAGFTVKPGGNGAAITEANVLPRLDVALNVKVANFVIEPSFTYLKQEYDMVRAGDEDSVDIWGLALGVSAGFGPFTARGEITYGQNLGEGNYVGGNGVARGWVNAAGFNQVEDTDIWAWWVDLGFNVGPFEIHGLVGMIDWQNDGSPLIANDTLERTRWFYGMNFPIKMTKNFTIKPEIMFYDDDSAGRSGAVTNLTTDYGDELIAGIQFQLNF